MNPYRIPRRFPMKSFPDVVFGLVVFGLLALCLTLMLAQAGNIPAIALEAAGSALSIFASGALWSVMRQTECLLPESKAVPMVAMGLLLLGGGLYALAGLASDLVPIPGFRQASYGFGGLLVSFAILSVATCLERADLDEVAWRYALEIQIKALTAIVLMIVGIGFSFWQPWAGIAASTIAAVFSLIPSKAFRV